MKQVLFLDGVCPYVYDFKYLKTNKFFKKETVFILMLCNKTLDPDIGGNFINQDTNEDISFKHGRVITFKANNKHKGLAFNKPYIPRISIKFVGE